MSQFSWFRFIPLVRWFYFHKWNIICRKCSHKIFSLWGIQQNQTHETAAQLQYSTAYTRSNAQTQYWMAKLFLCSVIQVPHLHCKVWGTTRLGVWWDSLTQQITSLHLKPYMCQAPQTRKWKYKGNDKGIYIYLNNPNMSENNKKLKEPSMNHSSVFNFIITFMKLMSIRVKLSLWCVIKVQPTILSNAFIIIDFCSQRRTKEYSLLESWMSHKMVRLYLIVS